MQCKTNAIITINNDIFPGCAQKQTLFLQGFITLPPPKLCTAPRRDIRSGGYVPEQIIYARHRKAYYHILSFIILRSTYLYIMSKRSLLSTETALISFINQWKHILTCFTWYRYVSNDSIYLFPSRLFLAQARSYSCSLLCLSFYLCCLNPIHQIFRQTKIKFLTRHKRAYSTFVCLTFAIPIRDGISHSIIPRQYLVPLCKKHLHLFFTKRDCPWKGRKCVT